MNGVAVMLISTKYIKIKGKQILIKNFLIWHMVCIEDRYIQNMQQAVTGDVAEF